MPDEHCRKCGNEQIPYAKCAKCRSDIQKMCISCGQRTLEQFHVNCFYDVECLQILVPRN